MILARHYGGFAAVDAMTWPDFALARRLLLEEQTGSLLRKAKREEDERERQARKHLVRKERA